MKMRERKHYNTLSTIDTWRNEIMWDCINRENWKFFYVHGRLANNLDELTDWIMNEQIKEYR
jgi:hypothetical protein